VIELMNTEMRLILTTSTLVDYSKLCIKWHHSLKTEESVDGSPLHTSYR